MQRHVGSLLLATFHSHGSGLTKHGERFTTSGLSQDIRRPRSFLQRLRRKVEESNLSPEGAPVFEAGVPPLRLYFPKSNFIIVKGRPGLTGLAHDRHVAPRLPVPKACLPGPAFKLHRDQLPSLDIHSGGTAVLGQPFGDRRSRPISYHQIRETFYVVRSKLAMPIEGKHKFHYTN